MRARSPARTILRRRCSELAQPGDMVVCLGAGSITNWANALPAELAELDAAEPGRMTRAERQRAAIS